MSIRGVRLFICFAVAVTALLGWFVAVSWDGSSSVAGFRVRPRRRRCRWPHSSCRICRGWTALSSSSTRPGQSVRAPRPWLPRFLAHRLSAPERSRAALVARDKFPQVIGHPDGGLPRLRAGERIARYVSPTAAALVLPDGRRGVIESLTPIARQSSPGGFSPVNLALTDAGNAYVPADSSVIVRISKQLAGGVALADTGVSLTPVDSSGRPCRDGGVRSATERACSTPTRNPTPTRLSSPSPAGFEIDALLRSPSSPREQRYRVGLPRGARLVRIPRSEAVSVVEGTTTIATVPPPVAVDAAGSSVPVRMTVAGQTIALESPHGPVSYRYPIDVDPTMIISDEQLTGHSAPTNWHFCTSVSSNCAHGRKSVPFQRLGRHGRLAQGRSDRGIQSRQLRRVQVQNAGRIEDRRSHDEHRSDQQRKRQHRKPPSRSPTKAGRSNS